MVGADATSGSVTLLLLDVLLLLLLPPSPSGCVPISIAAMAPTEGDPRLDDDAVESALLLLCRLINAAGPCMNVETCAGRALSSVEVMERPTYPP
jgi:hypothetical protein